MRYRFYEVQVRDHISTVHEDVILPNYSCLSKRNRVRIFTNSFTKEEVQILADSINAKLGIYVGVLHDRKDQWILTIEFKIL